MLMHMTLQMLMLLILQIHTHDPMALIIECYESLTNERAQCANVRMNETRTKRALSRVTCPCVTAAIFRKPRPVVYGISVNHTLWLTKVP